MHDTEGEWLVRLDTDACTFTREHAKGDVARAAASDLLLYFYGRADADRLDVFGDASLLERFRRTRQVVTSSATAVRSTFSTCSRRSASAPADSGSASRSPLIYCPSERYDNTAP